MRMPRSTEFAYGSDSKLERRARLIELNKRVRADGTVERVFKPEALPNDLKAVRDDGIDAVAIVFMHAWNYPVQSDSRLHRYDIGHGQQFHCAGTRDASCRPLLGGGDGECGKTEVPQGRIDRNAARVRPDNATAR